MTQRAEQWTKIVIRKTKLVFNCVLMDFPLRRPFNDIHSLTLSFVEIIDLALNDSPSTQTQAGTTGSSNKDRGTN